LIDTADHFSFLTYSFHSVIQHSTACLETSCTR